ncbi:MAG: RnfABCDGE type electron transport complex subunit C [Clostridia bacterium]|nr:RnfABCDGE type electron transport complex subunit C [Clostridia bacterium]MBO7156999.1 RnfABCDGE type electron transport complex subunit C [Clostridia bacterium]MBQ2254951.1 RnfABCDGE type electron transport complex subunit C [Clostridia bacterium]MBR6554282.1 RnfABCDGE type electron transport complex subunit C [Clostridia bacterium]
MKKDISSLHVPHNKHTAACVPQRIEIPAEVILPMNMHSGHDAEPIVKVGDHVKVGQLIAREEGRFSSPVHATISGTVVEIAPMATASGKETLAIRIESDGKMEVCETVKAPEFSDCDSFLQAVRDGGIVGLGGAAFPTWAKFNEATNPDYKVDTVLINAAECEPYITSDHRMMLAHPELIADGIEYLRKYMNQYLGNATYKICIETNKADAIEVLKKTFAGKDYVVIHELKTIYPQGAKQVMLYNATGRVAVAGKRFPSFGALIINVSSLAKMAEYLNTGMPLVERIVTVDGPAVEKPMNLIAPIGTRISELLKLTGLKSQPGKVVVGGPMNGTAICSVDDPIVKVSNAVLVFDEKSAVLPEASACINCGRCIEKCPVGISVADVDRYMHVENPDRKAKLLIKTGVRQCVDCACCSYVCPANRPLLQINWEAKAYLKKYAAAQKEKEGGKQ